MYTFDVVGCLERVRVACDGSAEELIQPVLDNLLERQHQQDKPKPPPLHCDYSREEVRPRPRATARPRDGHARDIQHARPVAEPLASARCAALLPRR